MIPVRSSHPVTPPPPTHTSPYHCPSSVDLSPVTRDDIIFIIISTKLTQLPLHIAVGRIFTRTTRHLIYFVIFIAVTKIKFIRGRRVMAINKIKLIEQLNFELSFKNSIIIVICIMTGYDNIIYNSRNVKIKNAFF